MSIKSFIIKKFADHRKSNSRKANISEIEQRKVDFKADKDLLDEHFKVWEPLTNWRDDQWINFYINVNNNPSPNYVTEPVYYNIIEPILNNSLHSKTYSDKNFYDLVYEPNLFPATIFRSINGIGMDAQYNGAKLPESLAGLDVVVAKPSIDSGGGAGVKLLKVINNELVDDEGVTYTLAKLNKIYKNNFILQERMYQHDFFKQFNESSINTVRVLAYRSVKTNEVHILHMVMRVGQKGEFVDNARAGGMTIGINPDGRLNDFGALRIGKKSALDKQYTMPFVKEMTEVAKKIAKKNIHHHLLGLDLTVDNNGVVRCVEVNNEGNGVNIYQLNFGPLFKEFTKEVREFCIENKDRLYANVVIRG